MKATELLDTMVAVTIEWHYGALLVEDDEGRSVLIQTDWDWPSMASCLARYDVETDKLEALYTGDCIGAAGEALDGAEGEVLYVDCETWEAMTD